MRADVHDSRSSLNAAQRLALLLVRGYQLLFAPLFAGSCRFTPSCSRYAAEAIERFGVVRGSYLAIRRLTRCHPFGAHGLDPVPDFAAKPLRRGRPDFAVEPLRRGRPDCAAESLRRGRPDCAAEPLPRGRLDCAADSLRRGRP